MGALPISQAPLDIMVSGLMHGAQRSPDAHTSCGRRLMYIATCGMQTLRQTPTALLSEWHAVGVRSVPAMMSGSGTQ
jgi:hypothetical protein